MWDANSQLKVTIAATDKETLLNQISSFRTKLRLRTSHVDFILYMQSLRK